MGSLHFIFWFSTAGLYIPPEYTRYSSDEAFNQIEHELHSFSTNSKYVGLIGDFIQEPEKMMIM